MAQPEVRIGPRLRDLRISAGLSQAELSEALKLRGYNVVQTHVSAMERGENQPSIEVCVGLARVLDTNVDYLLGLTDDPRSVGQLSKTVARVVDDEAARHLMNDIIARVGALSPESQKYANDLLARVFPDVMIVRGKA